MSVQFQFRYYPDGHQPASIARSPAIVLSWTARSQPVISRPMMAPSDDGDIAVEQQNPRRIGTAAHRRYDKYKAARTREELDQLGASRRDVTSGCRLGYIKTKPADIAAVRETLHKKPKKTKRAVKKETELFTAVMSLVTKLDIQNEKFDRVVAMCYHMRADTDGWARVVS